jgi:hypothetical protein
MRFLKGPYHNCFDTMARNNNNNEGLPLMSDLKSSSGYHQESYLMRLISVPLEILPLAVTTFGGPPAHLALAHDRFVRMYSYLRPSG